MLDAHYKGDIDISDYWAIGDSRTESISEIPSGTTGESQSAQEITLVIIGFDHDDLKTPVNNITKAAITVQTKDCLNAEGYMNYEYRSADYALWSKSQRRTWCNNEFIGALSTLKDLVKQVVKLSNRYGYDTSYTQQETTEDYVFILSECEILGVEDLSSIYGTLPDAGYQYEYMKTQSNRIKRVNGYTRYWWNRTSIVYNRTIANFFTIRPTGTHYDDGNAYASSGLVPAFCL